MARPDIRATDGLEAANDRARALVEAGTDAIFPEAMATLEKFQAIRDAVDVPILVNMTEFGKSGLFTIDELASVGINMVVYPVTLLRSAMGATESTLVTIKRLGSQEVRVGTMLARSHLYDLDEYNQFDTGVFSFQVEPSRESYRLVVGGVVG
jgi:methylisocitrate lyase